MNILSIDLENCFGIGQFNHKLDFSKTNINLIYAPNGTMKTSFAKTMELISKNDNQNSPCDQIYKSKRPKFEILVDQNQITPNSILVINAEDNKYDGSNSISTFLASQELKGRYDKIYRELEQSKSDFINNLRTVSKSTDCESEMIETFSTTENTSPTIYEIINSQVKNLKETFERPQFKYNEIFDKKNLVKKFLDKHKDILKQYVTTFNELLSKSNFFKNSKNNNFGTYQAKEIIKSIEDNSFFDAGHRFVLEDGTEINNSDSLKQIVESEINKILSDGKLRKSFEAVDKAISSNSELRTFKKIIDNNNLLLIQLNDYENFKKDVWTEYLSELKRDAEILNQNYLDKKEEIEKIIKEAKKEIELWNSIIKTFNSRFYVPFKVILTNQEDVILKLQTANLEFEYIEPDEKPIKRSREELLKTLSKGEQRAYFILQFLFEIESRKKNKFQSLLIFDDIADSFDYKNKYAVIEYIKDLEQVGLFKIILLTHNFDFYRTVWSRLGIPRNAVYMATKSETKKINLHQGQYRNDVFNYLIKNYTEKTTFICLIPFIRNLIEYSEGSHCNDYKTLTSCLHRKEGSEKLIINDISAIFSRRIISIKPEKLIFKDKNLFEFIKNTADELSSKVNLNEIDLQNKITISIAIRLETEKYIISKLSDINISEITSNQTQELCRKYKIKYPQSPAINIINKVNLMTPENIHINAFMYEPLIDMSIKHLIILYNEIKDLNNRQ